MVADGDVKRLGQELGAIDRVLVEKIGWILLEDVERLNHRAAHGRMGKGQHLGATIGASQWFALSDAEDSEIIPALETSAFSHVGLDLGRDRAPIELGASSTRASA